MRFGADGGDGVRMAGSDNGDSALGAGDVALGGGGGW